MEFEPLELEVTLFKTRIQEFIAIFDGKIDIPPSETVQGELVCFADSFHYLASAIGSKGRSFLEINIDTWEYRPPR